MFTRYMCAFNMIISVNIIQAIFCDQHNADIILFIGTLIILKNKIFLRLKLWLENSSALTINNQVIFLINEIYNCKTVLEGIWLKPQNPPILEKV